MKRAIAIASLVFISLTANCQKKDTTKVTAPVTPAINDSIKIASIRDFDRFNAALKEQVSFSTYIKLTPEQVLTEMVRWILAGKK